MGHVERDANRVAHKLAKEGVHQPKGKIWMNYFLDFIRDHVLAEALDVD